MPDVETVHVIEVIEFCDDFLFIMDINGRVVKMTIEKTKINVRKG